MDDACGFIVVSSSGITVRFQDKGATTEISYSDVTVESLADAARMLASWMELKYENIAKECQRIHAKDQMKALLKEYMAEYMQERED